MPTRLNPCLRAVFLVLLLALSLPAAISLSGGALPNGAVGIQYNYTLAATGGSGTYSYQLVAGGALPPGMTLSNGGLVAGTPTVAGNYSFSVQATDSTNATTTAAFTLLVNGGSDLQILTTSLPNGQIKQGYSGTITVVGGKTPYSFGVILAPGFVNLPNGLTIASTGQILGTPNEAGTFSFIIEVADSNGAKARANYTITIASNQLAIATTSLPNAGLNANYNFQLVATGGTAPYAFGYSGQLPPGILFSTSGILNGTPTQLGTYNLTFTVFDSSGQTAARSLTLVVTNAVLGITNTFLTAAQVNQPYTFTLSATGGTPPYSFTVSSGDLPAGITLNSTGVFSGTPTTVGNTSVTIRVTDNANPQGSAFATFNFAVNTNNLQITSTSLPNGVVGQTYFANLVATNGSPGYSWSLVNSSLPLGLSLTPNGAISGTPITSGNYTFVARVTDTLQTSTQATISLNIVSSSLNFTQLALPNATVNQPYNANITASGGLPNYLFEKIGGTLPLGLQLGANGSLSGTPTQSGNFSFVVRVTDAASSTTTGTFSINVLNGGFNITTSSLPAAVLNTLYTYTLAASGGTAPYTYSFFGGTIPPNLLLSTDGTLSGVPIQTGSFNFTVQVKDANQITAVANFTLTVNQSPITLTPATLTNAIVGQDYQVSLIAGGGTSPYSFNITSGSLPPGLNLSADGILSGKPSVTGTYNFTVKVTDNNGLNSSFNLSIISQTAGLTITTVTLPAAQLGSPYNNTIATSGGTPPFSFSISGGSFPPGLVLDQSSGAITGTPNTQGTYNFSISVSDSLSATASANLSITVNNAGTLTITTGSLPNGALNVAYNATISASGGSGVYSFSLNSGVLPLGLTLGTSGQLSGTPTNIGAYSFVVKVTDTAGATSLASFTVNIGTSAIGLSNTTLPLAQIGQPYNVQLTGTGGLAPYTYTISTGILPTGLNLNALTGVISGTPVTGGTFNLTFRVYDNTGANAFVNLSLVVNSGQLAFGTTSLPAASINTFYTTTLQAIGGLAPYSYSIASGVLPAGLSLNTATGVISGTPTVATFSTLTFRVTDSTGFNVTITLNLSVSQSTLQLASSTLPIAGTGQQYTATVAATGGSAPYTYTLFSGNLPTGLLLSTGGILSGIPTQTGTFNFVIRVVDNNNAAAQASFTLQVSSSILQILTTTLPAARLGQPYSQSINVSGGQAPLNFTLTGGILPAGLTLSSSGILSGTPTNAGTYQFGIRVTDATQFSVTANYTFTVSGNPPTLSTATLPVAFANQAFTTTFTATGGTPPYTFQTTTGILPTGLALNPNGALSGTPTQTGTFTFTVRVQDSAGLTSDGTFTITVNAAAAPVTIDAFAPPPAILNFPYNFSPSASGGAPPYRWSVTQGSLPSGISLNASTGAFSGSFLSPGLFRFTLRVTDALNTTADSQFSLNVAAPARLATATVGQSYTGQVPPPSISSSSFTYTLDPSAFGTFPDGLTLASSGAVTGTPTAAGEYTFGVLIRSASGTPSRAAVTIPVAPAANRPRIVNPSLPGAGLNVAYSAALVATGGREPYTWTIVSGQLPTGLSLNSATGNITGTPTAAGNSVVVIRATDADNNSASAYFTLSVLANSPILSAVTSAGSYGANGVAPGEVLVLFGGGLGPATLTTFTLQAGSVPTTLAGTRVLFDGVAAPLIYSGTGQVSAIAPFGLSTKAATRIVVEYNNVQSGALFLPVVSSKPALFTADGSGQGPGAILNENGSVNTAGNPAAKGSVVVLYMTGGGSMNPDGVDGAVASTLSSLTQAVTVTIGGQPAEVLYAGNAPGLVQGVIQMNVRVNPATASGAQPVFVRIGTNTTTVNATVAIQ